MGIFLNFERSVVNLKRVVFIDPNGNRNEITNIETLKGEIINKFETYWMQGSGDGFIDYYEDENKISTLLIGPNIEYGLYLHFVNKNGKNDLLSLYNKCKLDEVVETADEIYASIGLFLPIEVAWKVISDFVETGRASSKIEWITPGDIPENGNW